MFQQVFRAQSDELLFLPLIALVLFVGVFVLRVIQIARQDPARTKTESLLPLEEDRHG